MSRKPFHVEDAALWDEVIESVVPLRKRAQRPRKAPAGKPALKHSIAHIAPAPPPAKITPPPLTGLDRRTGQKMTRGQVEIEARIDLHGTSVEDARHRLHAFIIHQRAGGARTILVITGKGASPFAGHTLHGRDHFHAPERQGRIRRAFAGWLHEPEFRAHVSGFQPAHPKHGGGGAFYIRLRRLRPE